MPPHLTPPFSQSKPEQLEMRLLPNKETTYHDNNSLPLPVVSSAPTLSHKKETRRSTRMQPISLRRLWLNFKRRLSVPSSTFTESLPLDTTPDSDISPADPSVTARTVHTADSEKDGAPELVEVVIVDNSFTNYSHDKSVNGSDPPSHEKSGASHHSHHAITTDGAESIQNNEQNFFLWTLFRYRVVPILVTFFAPSFQDLTVETAYLKEGWHNSKLVAMFSSLFYVLNWVLGLAFVPKPFVLADKIFYYGVAPLFTLPLPFFVLYDWPRKFNITYQFIVGLSTWICYSTALQTIAIFGLKLKRLIAMTWAIIFFILMCALVVPVRHSWIRTALNYVAFQLFLLYLHWSREMQERRLYTLRMQLKVQYITTQKAQVAEREAADSKRRLTSYIFHEVRVPLNTALLAVQNMAASGLIRRDRDIEFTALEGSLTMMSKVLNDVLDFNRMETGRFESVDKPFSLHRVIRSMLGPLHLSADAKDHELVVDLDRNIDIMARRAQYRAQHLTEEDISQRLATDPEEEGVIVGDEMRLRQLLTNLTSNASKFTPAGGKITIVTKLLLPEPIQRPVVDTDHRQLSQMEHYSELSAAHIQVHNNLPFGRTDNGFIVVRIEVRDTGLGIKPQDLMDNKLFSAYVQTEIGRSQGGKGADVSMAWVRKPSSVMRHIVSLGKGRLGVQSQLGQGSTFWIELAFGVGSRIFSLNNTESPNLQPNSFLGGLTQKQTGFLIVNERHGVHRSGQLAQSAESSAAESHEGNTHAETGNSSEAFSKIMEQDRSEELTSQLSEAANIFNTIVSTAERQVTTPIRSHMPIQRPTFVELPPRPAFSTSVPSPGAASVPPTPAFLGENKDPSQTSLNFEIPLIVLCVDDDLLTRTLMKKMLSRLGCTVFTAPDGQRAFELIMSESTGTSEHVEITDSSITIDRKKLEPTNRGKFDIIFLDNQMPVLSGVALTQRLREMGRVDFIVGVTGQYCFTLFYSGLFIVTIGFATGNALLNDIEEYKQAGANHVLTKPVMEKKLRTMLILANERRKSSSQIHTPDPR